MIRHSVIQGIVLSSTVATLTQFEIYFLRKLSNFDIFGYMSKWHLIPILFQMLRCDPPGVFIVAFSVWLVLSSCWSGGMKAVSSWHHTKKQNIPFFCTDDNAIFDFGLILTPGYHVSNCFQASLFDMF